MGDQVSKMYYGQSMMITDTDDNGLPVDFMMNYGELSLEDLVVTISTHNPAPTRNV